MPHTFNELSEHLLCAPGRGVHTVHTASDKKIRLDNLLYDLREGEERDATALWREKLKSLSTHKGPVILGVCSDTGGGIQRGANWGPLTVRVAMAEAKRLGAALDLGDIRVVPHLLHDKYLNQETIAEVREALYSDRNVDYSVSPLSMTEEVLEAFYREYKDLPVFALGGDHSVSYALTTPYLRAKRAAGVKVGLLHFDAHTDLLTKRLGIDLCFGSWVPHIMEYLPNPKAAAQVGIRSTGKHKSHWESTFGLKQYWAHEVKEEGPEAIAKAIATQFRAQGISEIYVSFDIDALDKSYASATGTPEDEGLEPHECLEIMKALEAEFPISGADLVEVAPFVQFDHSRNSMEQTLESAQIIGGYLLDALERWAVKQG